MIKNGSKYGSGFTWRIRPFIALARPGHYIKNGFVLVPLFFAHRLADSPSLASALLGFAGFCMASSAVYVFNDIMDRDKDAAHPVKRERPLAAGAVSIPRALMFCLVLSVMAGLFCLLVFRVDYSKAVLLYVVLNLLYSFKLQNIAVINAGCVAAGFVLRVFAGAAVIDVPVSFWLAGLTFLLALFLAFAKRRCDAVTVGPPAAATRKPLSGGLILLALACLAGYAAYTLSPAVIREHAAPGLYLTTVWVALGLFRYLRIGLDPANGCSPVSVFLKDRPLQLCVLLWVVTLWWMLYRDGG